MSDCLVRVLKFAQVAISLAGTVLLAIGLPACAAQVADDPTTALARAGCAACHNPNGIPYFPPYDRDMLEDLLLAPPAGMTSFNLDDQTIGKLLAEINQQE